MSAITTQTTITRIKTITTSTTYITKEKENGCQSHGIEECKHLHNP
jgi:hypothetical protein